MIRRKFLQSLGLAGLGLSLPVQMVNAQDTPTGKNQKFNLKSIVVKGKVHQGGKGIANVAVTDGYNIVLTDTSGKYTLNTNAIAEFVYISVPRGYEIPQEKGIAQFFKPLNKAASKFTADFELQTLAQDDTKHNFIVWADPQIIDKQDAEQLVNKTAPDVKSLLATYDKNILFHGIGCGDLVWDKFELYDDYKKAVALAGIPFYQVIGNHDMDLTARTDDGSGQTFKSLFGPTYYSYNRGEVHYVVLDDVFFIGTAKKYIGYLTETQLQWLEQDLQHVKPGSTVVVAVHIPVNSGEKRRMNLKEESIGGVVSNRKELYRLLKPFKAHILSGHTHICEKVIEGNVMEHVHGAVCGAWWTGPICSDGTPNGYGVYEVNGSEIQWYYKSVGHMRDHQLRVYKTGAVAEKPNEFVANVWNWDPEWKVEWYEDGVKKGEMRQEMGLDPLSVQLHLGPQLPAKHKWVDPTVTDHLFFAKPSANARQIKVEATDRFGNVYAETLALA